jgi:hypothetical protein
MLTRDEFDRRIVRAAPDWTVRTVSKLAGVK